MKIHYLMTKWSDLIILEHHNRYALIDTGFEEQYPMLSDYLDNLGVKTIDFILLTHFHRDHYGCIPKLLMNYSVTKVYLKEYSGLDCTTAWGAPADDAYRESEMTKYQNMCKTVQAYSKLCPVETLSEISFFDIPLKLYFTNNTIREIYEDASRPETYHKIAFSENQNSLGAWMNYRGKNIFFGGDLQDLPSSHPLGNFVVRQIANEIGLSMDYYKVPHHGTVHTSCPETHSIFKPRIAIITNEDAYLREHSDIYQNLSAANPDVNILLTEKQHVVLDLDN